MAAAPAAPAAAGGSVIAQLVCEKPDGERTGPQIDMPLGTTPDQLAAVVNALLHNEAAVAYAFYVGAEEVTTSLAAAIGGASGEQAVRIVFAPQAVEAAAVVEAAADDTGDYWLT